MDQTWQPYNLETYAGGVSSAVSPDLLPPNQTAWGMNVDFRGTKIHTRPNIHQRMYLPSGLVQGAGYFNLQGGMLVAMIDGVPYRLRIGVRNGDFSFDPIVLPFYNSPIIKQVWMCQTVESLIIQDGQSQPIIYDGSSARRANRLQAEVPIGLQMAYGNGRLWVAIQGTQLVAGDIRTPEAGSELFFTETQYLSGGGALIFQDNLTGLAFIPVTGTSDYGALVALGRNYVDTIRADISQRDAWASYPGFVTNAMRNVGTPSGWTIVQVNQDLMWRDALGGIRSLNTSLSGAYYAQYRGAQSAANVPISREVSRLTEFDSQQLLGFSSGIYFDNRLLMTSSPFLNKQGGVSHRDLISLDFAPVSTMQGQSPPAYNGTWQGVDWTQLVKGEFNGQSRAFGISSDEDGFNRLWEFDTSQVDDVYISDGAAMTDGTALPVALSPIECFVEYPRIDFGDLKRRKRLTRCDVWMSNLTGKVDLTVYWRPDNNQKWTLWDETSHCAIMQDAATATPHVWKNLLPEQRPLVKSFSIPDTLDDVTTYALATGFGFQIRLAWTGSVKIERVVIWAQAVDSTDYVEREGQEPTCITNDVTGNEIRYEIPAFLSVFSYDLYYAGSVVPVGGDIVVGSTSVGSSIVPIQIRNTGNASLHITNIALSNTNFSLSGVVLPVVLVPDEALNFNVVSPSGSSLSVTVVGIQVSEVSVSQEYNLTVTSPVLFYDVSQMVGFTNGQLIASLPDFSGNGLTSDINSPFSAVFNTNSQNGLSGINCQMFRFFGRSNITLGTVFFVARIIASSFSGSPNGVLSFSGVSPIRLFGIAGTNKFDPSGIVGSGRYFLNGQEDPVNYAASCGACGVYAITVNASEISSGISFPLGQFGNGNSGEPSIIYSVLVFSAVLPPAQVQSISQTLMAHWGV
jgi:hypothetical protein